ncbi:hypothetical protein OAG36_00460 [bacterium]|nr:hypothetical protein [bacterium]
MSITCDNTTPLGSKRDSTILNTNSDALIAAILDLQKLADESTSNLNNANRAAIVGLTNGLNNILTNNAIDEFPRLKERVEQNGGVSYTDIADFITTNNGNVDDLTAAVDDFNTNSASTLTANMGSGAGTGTDDLDSTRLLNDALATVSGVGVLNGGLDLDLSGTQGSGGLGTGSAGSGLTGNLSGVTGGGTELNTGSGPSNIIGDVLGLSINQPLTSSTSTTIIGEEAFGVGSDPLAGLVVGSGGLGTGNFPVELTDFQLPDSSGDAATTGGGGLGTFDPIALDGDGNPVDLFNLDNPQDFNSATGNIDGVQGTSGSGTAIASSFIVASTLALQDTQYGASGDMSLSDKLAILSGRKSLYPVIVYKLMQDLDLNFAMNLGQDLSSSICGVYNDVLEKVTKVFAFVNTGKALLSQVENLLEKDVKKLAESIKQKGILQTLLDILKRIIQEAVNAARDVATAAVAAVLGAVYGMYKASMAVMKKVGKIIQDINNYMQDATIQSIIQDMEKLVVKLADQFERLTPQNIANIIFRLCQMARDIQAKLMEPALKMQRFAGSLATESRVLQSQNAVNTQKAVKYGAIRISDEERESKKQDIIVKNSKVPPSDQEADFLTKIGMTPEEAGLVTSVNSNPDATQVMSTITFSSKVISDKEFQGVNDMVWVRLIRTARQTGESYEVKSAKTAKSRNPKRMGGVSNTIHNTGYAVDITVTESNRDDTIVAASRAGFGGIGVYRNHLHLDTSSRRSWVSGFSGQALTSIKELTEKHDIDGFRKKRS